MLKYFEYTLVFGIWRTFDIDQFEQVSDWAHLDSITCGVNTDILPVLSICGMLHHGNCFCATYDVAQVRVTGNGISHVERNGSWCGLALAKLIGWVV